MAGQRGSSGSTGGRSTDAFAVFVALGALVAAGTIFFSQTVPAFRENRELQRIETEKRELRDQLAKALHTQRSTSDALEWDIQTVLAAIDELGLTPTDLLSQPETDGR